MCDRKIRILVEIYSQRNSNSREKILKILKILLSPISSPDRFIMPCYSLPSLYSGVIWTPNPSGCMHEGLRNDLAQECHCWNATVFKSCKMCSQIFKHNWSGLLQLSKFPCYSVFCCVFISCHFKCWLADVAFFPSSTPTAAFQDPRHFWGSFISLFPWPERSGVQTIIGVKWGNWTSIAPMVGSSCNQILLQTVGHLTHTV